MGQGMPTPIIPAYWRDDELVDSSNLTVGDHCRTLAEGVEISGPGKDAMVKELRTIACQARKMAEKSDMKNGHAYRNLMKAIERLSVLASVLEEKS